MGQFPIFPQTYCPGDELDNCVFQKYDRAVNYDNNSIRTSPGYFGLGLVNGIDSEMTVSNHSALYHFKFPDSTPDGSPVSPLMILDLTDLADSRQNASVNVDEKTGRVTANGTFFPSFGVGTYSAYTCADFQGAAVRDTGVYVSHRAGTYPKSLFVDRGINLFYQQAGGFVRFQKPTTNNTLSVRVGMSFISTEQACHNAETEIPDWDFAKLKKTAEDAWHDKLGVVSVDRTGVDKDLLTTFWSAVYRTWISPQDYTGENPLWKSSEPYFDSFYWCVLLSCFWGFTWLTRSCYQHLGSVQDAAAVHDDRGSHAAVAADPQSSRHGEA